MMRMETLVAEFPDLDPRELAHWVERHWIVPDRDDSETWLFTDIDVARVRLIHDLQRDLDIADDMIPLILSLLDQVYDLRCALRSITRAIETQPADVRASIESALHALSPGKEA